MQYFPLTANTTKDSPGRMQKGLGRGGVATEKVGKETGVNTQKDNFCAALLQCVWGVRVSRNSGQMSCGKYNRKSEGEIQNAERKINWGTWSEHCDAEIKNCVDPKAEHNIEYEKIT